ncbi:cytochrome P450 6g1 isoform X1 [Stomoxys calcitrans]|uniref:cytochrome P450 6g1 isoform X1 n=1 Tax=Stomoxys calcitrans TaxID=35570 RepID=UPI0027E35393|nr:cytochrome P450 6g1 isoform X1 [Stomoxys calcitrans]
MLCTIVCILFLALLLALYVCYKVQFSYWSRRNIIPSVPGKIFSGNLIEFLTFKTNFAYHLKTIYDDPQFIDVPVVGVYDLFKPSLFIRDPELIKSVLVRDFESFPNRFPEMDLNHDPIGARSMFFTKYSIWKKMRTKLNPLFTSAKLKNMYYLIQNVCKNMEHHLDQQAYVYRVEMKDFCARYTTDIIATTLLGFQSNSLENPAEELNKEVRKLADYNWRLAFDYMIIIYFPKLAKFFGSRVLYPQTELFFRSCVPRAIAEREHSDKCRFDLIDMLVKLKREAISLGENMKDFMYCLIAQAMVMTVAGFETSSTTMANALLELAKQPDLQKRLKDEIRTAFSRADQLKIPYEDLNKLEYMDMVVSETLRLYPVLPVLQRICQRPPGKAESYSLKPYCEFSIPDGMPVYISMYGLHYDPKYWTNPTTFDPERFSAENKQSLNPGIYLPFGMGPHNCIGVRLGLLQVKCGLLHLLRNHHVRVCEATVLKPEFEAKSILLQLKGGVYLEIVKDCLSA